MELPFELNEEVASHLTGYDVLNLCTVSKTFIRMCLSERLWQSLMKRDYPHLKLGGSETWRNLYQTTFKQDISNKKNTKKILRQLKSSKNLLEFTLSMSEALDYTELNPLVRWTKCSPANLSVCYVEFTLRYDDNTFMLNFLTSINNIPITVGRNKRICDDMAYRIVLKLLTNNLIEDYEMGN